MLNAIHALLKRHPVRLRLREKQAFITEAAAYMEACGFRALLSKDRFLLQNRNLIAGDPERAEFIFTAHYDTPFRMFLPANTLFPEHMLLSLLFQLIPMLLPLLPALGLCALLPLSGFWAAELPILLYFALLLLCFMAIPNRHNVNDNGSGLAMLLCLAGSIPPEQRGRASFVFFDHEELGLLGSAAFARRYKRALKGKVLVNFDCVGLGDELMLLAGPALVKDQALFARLKGLEASRGEKRIRVVDGKGWFYPSDQMNFKRSLGAAAFRRGKLGLYLSRIHSSLDTRMEDENIRFLSAAMLKLLQ